MVIRSIFAFIIGLTLIMWSEEALHWMVKIIGIIILLPYVVVLINYVFRKIFGAPGIKVRFPIDGMFGLILGLLLLMIPDVVVNIFVICLGILLIFGAVQQLWDLITVHRKKSISLVFYIIPILILIAGIVAVYNPFEVQNAVLIVIGTTMVVYALSGLIMWFKLIRNQSTD